MELREYQRQALEHFARHDRCALWAGMGMGKTVTTLTHVDALATVEGDRTLVIAPRRVAVGTWPEEAAEVGV